MSATGPTTNHDRIFLMGVPFDRVTMIQTLDAISKMIAAGRPHYVATANVDFLVQSQKDAHLRDILLGAHLIVCDGMPVMWLSKLAGKPLPERVAGSDMVPALLDLAEQKGWGVYFLGGDENVAQLAAANVSKKHPNLRIAGVYSPPFAPFDQMDHAGICARIREATPDLLFVSFGCPKQEKWIAQHYQALGVPVSIGVGATIDFLAGTKKRAPRWMQVAGMEWVFRLLQEPRRLWKRYFVDILVFGKLLARELLTSGRKSD